MSLTFNYQRIKKYLKAGRGRKKTPDNILTKGKIKIICSGYGIRLYWGEVEVTQGVGFNSAINTLGLWTDSSLADWQILERTDDYFKLKVFSLPYTELEE